MDLEVHFQNLASLNINPDEIENEQYAKAFNSSDFPQISDYYSDIFIGKL
jgi:hypothetical protein